jgi:ribonucleoside-diphosphate reductase beta chain
MIFDKRVNLKPYEYPELLDFVDAINQTMWFHTKWSFKTDVADFQTKLSPQEQDVIKKSLLAIAQIEVSVKTFWGKLYDHFPKPEINSIGATFAESEVRHERAYSMIIDLLKMNDEYNLILDVPEIKGRVDYLQKYLSNAGSNVKEKYVLTLTLFSLFIENVSLFSQFFIVKSFNKHKKILKDIDNVIMETAKEENIHAELGAYLFNIIKSEYPELIDDEFNNKIIRACHKAYLAEMNIVKWILGDSNFDFINYELVDNFIKDRFNKSLIMVGLPGEFEVNLSLLPEWFDVEDMSTVHVDFFHKKSPNYTKNAHSLNPDELF